MSTIWPNLEPVCLTTSLPLPPLHLAKLPDLSLHRTNLLFLVPHSITQILNKLSVKTCQWLFDPHKLVTASPPPFLRSRSKETKKELHYAFRIRVTIVPTVGTYRSDAAVAEFSCSIFVGPRNPSRHLLTTQTQHIRVVIVGRPPVPDGGTRLTALSRP